MSLSTLISAATQLGGGLARGQGQVLDQRRQQQLQDYQISRQQQQDHLRQQLEDRQQSQLEQQTAIRNRLQGVIPSSTPFAKDPLTRMQGDAGSEPIPISRDARLAKMEAPDDPNAPQSAVPLPNVDLGAVHQAELDKSRKASGVPGFDINFDDSLEGHKERAKSSQNEEKYQAAMDRLTTREGAIDARTANTQDQIGDRQATHDKTTFTNNKALAGIKGQQVMQQIEARGKEARDTKLVAPPGQGGTTQGVGGGTVKISDATRKLQGFADQAARSYSTMQELASKVNPDRVSALMQFPRAANRLVTKDEQRYVQAFLDFNASITHQESGARVSLEQQMRDYRRHGVVTGDAPETIQAKLEAAWQKTLEQQRGGYGGDAPAIAAERLRFLNAIKAGAPYLEARKVFDAQVAKIQGGGQ